MRTIKWISVFLMLLILPNLSYGEQPDSTYKSLWCQLEEIKASLFNLDMKLNHLEKKYLPLVDFKIQVEAVEKDIKKRESRLKVLEKRKTASEVDRALQTLLDSLDIILERSEVRIDLLLGL